MSVATTAATGVRGADGSPATGEFRRSGAESLDAWIESVRRQHNIPALGAIVFRADTVLTRGIAGVRRSNSTAVVGEHDRFQLGSNTKAITATVLATLVEEGKLAWTTTLADVFPERRDSMS
jgi:CubicO group peptidase (beta-lactamase class C family)